MFDATTLRDIRLHAESEYPCEACGLIAGGKYRPCKNKADDPGMHFIIDPVDQILCEQYGPIEAVIHSHVVQHSDPIQNNWPSLTDQEEQIKSGDPWGICVVINGRAQEPYFWGDSLPVAHYLGRPFIHGVYDCYSLIRDYYRKEHAITFSPYARAWGWWDETPGADLYSRNFANEGFSSVSFEELRPGDVVLGTVLSSNVVNHGGVYLGNSLFMHHLVGRESKQSPIGQWKKLIRHYLRHESLK